MIEEIYISQRFGDLTVLNIEAGGKILCECSCGAELRMGAYDLVQGNRVRCKKCDQRLTDGAQLTVDLVELEGLKPRIKKRILRAYTEHLQACQLYGTMPTQFVIFVREFKADPDFDQEEPPALTWEERLVLSNPLRYSVYDRPKELL
jgi:hypothetical protein